MVGELPEPWLHSSVLFDGLPLARHGERRLFTPPGPGWSFLRSPHDSTLTEGEIQKKLGVHAWVMPSSRLGEHTLINLQVKIRLGIVRIDQIISFPNYFENNSMFESCNFSTDQRNSDFFTAILVPLEIMQIFLENYNCYEQGFFKSWSMAPKRPSEHLWIQGTLAHFQAFIRFSIPMPDWLTPMSWVPKGYHSGFVHH